MVICFTLKFSANNDKRLSSEHTDDSIAYASDEVEGKPEAEQDAEVDEPDTEVEGKPDAEPDAEELDA